MSGVAIIRKLLANDAALLAVVPAARIVAGDLVINTILPAIAITSVDSVPHLNVRLNAGFHTDRVQVTAFVKGTTATPPGLGYRGIQDLLRLILAACPNTKGTVITGATVDSVVPGIEGPDFYDNVTGIHSRSRDFFVKYTL